MFSVFVFASIPLGWISRGWRERENEYLINYVRFHDVEGYKNAYIARESIAAVVLCKSI